MNKTTATTMAAEGGTMKKVDPADEEQRLRERLKRRKEDRSRSRDKNNRGPPARDFYGRGPPPGRHWRGGGPPRGDWRGGPPPRDWRGGGPPRGDWRGRHPGVGSDRYGRQPPPRRHRSYSRSRSRSRGRSRSRSSSRSYSSSDDDSRSRSRSADSRSSRSRSGSVSSSASAPDYQEDPEAYALTKDQRTVFVSQLVMRTDERDIRRFFRRKIGVKVNDVALLRDKRTGRHKGFCYVELARLEDVGKAVAMNNQAPDFQRFPILIKASEAEKNYSVPSAGALTAAMVGAKSSGPGPNGKIQEAQKAYVGNLDPSVTQEHIYSLFSCFGSLNKVMLQTDPLTNLSKGFCFLSYRDAKDANLAIQTMSGQTLMGRPLKTGWANHSTTTSPNIEVVTSIEFPDDAPDKIQNAHLALAQLAGTGLTNVAPIVPPSDVANAAEAAINAALGLPVTAAATAAAPVVAPQVAAAASPVAATAGTIEQQAASSPAQAPQGAATEKTAVAPVAVSPDATVVGGADNPTTALLVHNMFDKDTETEPNWEEEIRLDFEDECAKYGIAKVVVMSKEIGGKIYASFKTVDGAKECASALAGRWFDKRQLRVEFVPEDSVPASN